MTELAKYWEEAQIIGALATAITFILILITFVIDRRRERREFLEKYKLAFLEYTHRQKELLAAFELKYLRRREELIQGEEKYRIIEKIVANYLKETEKPSAYGLLAKVGIFDEEELLRLTHILTSNPFLRSDFKLTFNAALHLLDRLNERLKEFHGRIECLAPDRTAEVLNLASDWTPRPSSRKRTPRERPSGGTSPRPRRLPGAPSPSTRARPWRRTSPRWRR